MTDLLEELEALVQRHKNTTNGWRVMWQKVAPGKSRYPRIIYTVSTKEEAIKKATKLNKDYFEIEVYWVEEVSDE